MSGFESSFPAIDSGNEVCLPAEALFNSKLLTLAYPDSTWVLVVPSQAPPPRNHKSHMDDHLWMKRSQK